MEDERWYTVLDIVDMLDVHEQTVRRWLRTGRLAGYDFGGRTGYRIKEADLREFIEGHATGKAIAA